MPAHFVSITEISDFVFLHKENIKVGTAWPMPAPTTAGLLVGSSEIPAGLIEFVHITDWL